jgi:hypothetical protein
MRALLILAFLCVFVLPFPLWLIALGLVIYIAHRQYQAEASKVKDIKMKEPIKLVARDTPFRCTCGSPAYYSDLWSKDAYAHGCIAEFTCQKGHIFTRIGEQPVGTRVEL